jgi:hypothetical protein
MDVRQIIAEEHARIKKAGGYRIWNMTDYDNYERDLVKAFAKWVKSNNRQIEKVINEGGEIELTLENRAGWGDEGYYIADLELWGR